MKKHFATLKEAREAWTKRTGVPYKDRFLKYSGSIRIFNRNKSKGRTKTLKRPYFVGSEFEWLNLY